MKPDGSERIQLTHYQQWPVQSPTLSDGKIVFQYGADLMLYTMSDHHLRKLNISLMTDEPFRQQRWIDNPLDYVTDRHLTPDGKRLVITARGQVAIATMDGSRLIEIQTPAGSRVKFAQMSHDGQWIYGICDASGEEQIWRFAADGSGHMKQLTHGGHSIHWSLSLSPDGRFLLTDDKEGHLWLVTVKTGAMKQLLSGGSANQAFGNYHWSVDSQYLAIETALNNGFRSTIILYDLKTDRHQQLTTDKYDSFSPVFSPDGQWLYFLSKRAFHVQPSSPWEDRTPDPSFLNRTQIFAIALKADAQFPFQPANELLEQRAQKSTVNPTDSQEKGALRQSSASKVDWQGITKRLWQVPVDSGNYSHLTVANQGLLLLNQVQDEDCKIQSILYSHRHVELKTLKDDVQDYALSQHRDHLLIINDDGNYIVPATTYLPEDDDMGDYLVDTSQWHMVINPTDEWLEMFRNAWLMHRDIFYDPQMRGIDWNAVKKQVQPLVARVSDRYELTDLLGQMISPLNTLHSQVRSGDDTPEMIDVPESASLGAEFRQTAEGVKIVRIYRSDPEVPALASPLAKPGVDVRNGDLLISINGHSVHSVADVYRGLRDQVGKQVLLAVRRSGQVHRTIVSPVKSKQNRAMRYRDWTEHNREQVVQQSHNQIGYIFLCAMDGEDFDTFVREFYANYRKQGLIIDVRNNLGGNVDSWIIDKLMRRAWMFWKPRQGRGYVNLQQTFRGHLVVIANQITYSDGETFTAGVKALGLAPVIGMRTFGAGVWLNDNTELADKGRTRVAQYPQYLMNGQWVVEQHGVSPTIEVDNLPHASYEGYDAQLQKAIAYLKRKIKMSPVSPLVPVMSAGRQEEAEDIISFKQ
jgi:tricorn protease